jgi:hypothetical protein
MQGVRVKFLAVLAWRASRHLPKMAHGVIIMTGPDIENELIDRI